MHFEDLPKNAAWYISYSNNLGVFVPERNYNKESKRVYIARRSKESLLQNKRRREMTYEEAYEFLYDKKPTSYLPAFPWIMRSKKHDVDMAYCVRESPHDNSTKYVRVNGDTISQKVALSVIVSLLADGSWTFCTEEEGKALVQSAQIFGVTAIENGDDTVTLGCTTLSKSSIKTTLDTLKLISKNTNRKISFTTKGIVTCNGVNVCVDEVRRILNLS